MTQVATASLPSFTPQSTAVAQEFEAWLGQLSGPMAECQMAAVDSTGHLLNILSAAEAQLVQQLQVPPGPQEPDQRPDLLLAGLGLAREQVCRVASTYLSTLHQCQQQCMDQMESQTAQHIAQERVTLAKDYSALEAQRKHIAQHKAAVQTAMGQLKDQIKLACKPMVVERKRMQASVEECVAEVEKCRAALVRAEEQLAVAKENLALIETQAMNALEPFKASKIQMTLDLEAMEAQEAELSAFAAGITERHAQIEQQMAEHTQMMRVLREQGAALGLHVRHLRDLGGHAAVQAQQQATRVFQCLRAAESPAQDDADEEVHDHATTRAFARLQQVLSSTPNPAPQQGKSHDSSKPGTPAKANRHTTAPDAQAALQQLELHLAACGIATESSAVTPGWEWEFVLQHAATMPVAEQPKAQVPHSPTDSQAVNPSSPPAMGDAPSELHFAVPKIKGILGDSKNLPATPTLNGASTPDFPALKAVATNGHKESLVSGQSGSPGGQVPIDTRSHTARAAKAFLGRSLNGQPLGDEDLSLPSSPAIITDVPEAKAPFQLSPERVRAALQAAAGGGKLDHLLSEMSCAGSEWVENQAFELGVTSPSEPDGYAAQRDAPPV